MASDIAQPVTSNNCDDCTCTANDSVAGRKKPLTWSDSMAEIVRGNLEARRMFPLSYMELILTSDCNLQCSHCFERDKQPFDMSDEIAFAAVDFLVQTSRNIKDLTILLFGGEPMMRFDLIQRILPYAKGIYTSFLTPLAQCPLCLFLTKRSFAPGSPFPSVR